MIRGDPVRRTLMIERRQLGGMTRHTVLRKRVRARIVSQSGLDGRNMAGRQADRGPQGLGPDEGVHPRSMVVCRDGGQSFSRPLCSLDLLIRYMLHRQESPIMPGLLESFA